MLLISTAVLPAVISFIAKSVPKLQAQNIVNTNCRLVARFCHSGFMGSRAIIVAQNLPHFGGSRPRQAEESSFEPGTTGGKGRSHAELHWRHRTGGKEDYPRNPCKDCEGPQMSCARTHLEDLISFFKWQAVWFMQDKIREMKSCTSNGFPMKSAAPRSRPRC